MIPRRGLAALVAATLVAAGCGDSGDRSPAESESAVASDAAATPDAPGAGARSGRLRLVQVGGRFDQPVLATSPPGDPRLFVVEQTGRIWIVERGRRRPRPFLDVSSQIRAGGEQGLLGLAFAPDFAKSGRFVIDYTNRDGDTRVVLMTAAGNVARPGGTTLLAIDQPYPNHNGGALAFGPDGNLYIGMGDGGSGGDPQRRAQNPRERLGKILRIDLRRRTGGRPYAIPPDNPYARGGGAAEVWALGLRNPWRFSFDPATGDFWIGDVGQGEVEEIDRLPRGTKPGANLGWNLFEGRKRFSGDGRRPPRYVPPVGEFFHEQGACSVTGGVVVRDPALPRLAGRYLYGDFCAGFVRTLDARTGRAGSPADLTRELGGALRGLSSFGTDAAGRVYLVVIDGLVLRLTQG